MNSACSRSSLESSCMPAHSAPCADQVHRDGRVVLVVDARGSCGSWPRRRPPGRGWPVTSSGMTTIGWSCERWRARPARSGFSLTPLDVLEAVAAALGRSRRRAPRLVAACGCRRRPRASRPATPGMSFSASATSCGARALVLEAAAGQVLGLLRGERERDDQEAIQTTEDETPTARDEALEPVHGCLHVRLSYTAPVGPWSGLQSGPSADRTSVLTETPRRI